MLDKTVILNLKTFLTNNKFQMLLRFLSFQNLFLEEQHGLERCHYSHFFSEKSENYMRAPLFSDNFPFVEVRYQIKIFCVKFHHKNILKCSYFCKKCI